MIPKHKSVAGLPLGPEYPGSPLKPSTNGVVVGGGVVVVVEVVASVVVVVVVVGISVVVVIILGHPSSLHLTCPFVQRHIAQPFSPLLNSSPSRRQALS